MLCINYSEIVIPILINLLESWKIAPTVITFKESLRSLRNETTIMTTSTVHFCHFWKSSGKNASKRIRKQRGFIFVL